MQKKYLLIVIFATVFACVAAKAEVDIRVHYNYLSINPSDLQTLNTQYQSAYAYPKITSMTGVGGDVIYFLPVVSLGFGARYDSFTAKSAGTGGDLTLTANRTALLVDYRFINTLVFLGAIASYGISHDMKVKSTGSSDLKTASQESYSVGVEGGAKVGHFIAGGEIGYLSFIGTDIKSNSSGSLASVTTTNGKKTNMDISGVYIIASVGVTF